MRGKRFLFLGGLHRSGTSIAHRLLREHPETSGISGSAAPQDEGQHLQTVFPTAKDYGGPGRFAFADASHLTETSSLALPANRDRLLREWGPWYDLERVVLLEKSPPNLLRTRFLQSLLPGSCFVMLVRHPIAVSLATVKWSKTPIFDLLNHWLRAHQIFLEDHAYLENCLVLRYEDLVTDSASCLHAICNLAELAPFAPREPVSDHNAQYFDRWNERIDEYRKDLQQADTELVSFARRFGYTFEPPFTCDPVAVILQR